MSYYNGSITKALAELFPTMKGNGVKIGSCMFHGRGDIEEMARETKLSIVLTLFLIQHPGTPLYLEGHSLNSMPTARDSTLSIQRIGTLSQEVILYPQR